jgi:hypothetical protein
LDNGTAAAAAATAAGQLTRKYVNMLSKTMQHAAAAGQASGYSSEA